VVDWNDTNVFPRLVDKQSVSCSRSEVRIRHVNNIARHREPSWDLNERNWNEHRHIFFTKRDAVSPSNASPNELVHREAWCPKGGKLELVQTLHQSSGDVRSARVLVHS